MPKKKTLQEMIAEAETKPPIPWEEFALSGVDWEEWPGGAAEIVSAYNTQRARVGEMAILIRGLADEIYKTNPDSPRAKKAMDYITRNLNQMEHRLAHEEGGA